MCYYRTYAYTVHNTAYSSYKIGSQIAIVLMDNDKQRRIIVLIMWFNVDVNQNAFKRDITNISHIIYCSRILFKYFIMINVTNSVRGNLKSKLLVCCLLVVYSPLL